MCLSFVRLLWRTVSSLPAMTPEDRSIITFPPTSLRGGVDLSLLTASLSLRLRGELV